MTDLDEMQHWIVQQLRSTQRIDRQQAATPDARRYLTGNDRLSPEEQLEIYRVQFWLRHTSSLIDDYPGVSGILGQKEWERLVESYLTSKSPDSWSLRNLGDHLPRHIEQRTETPHHALCLDMARLEWAYIEIFDAAECEPLDAERLTRFPEEAWETARIVLSPALRLLQVGYPVAELRRRLKAAAASASTEPVAIPDPEAQHLVLYRAKNRSLYHRSVEPLAYELLSELHAGTALVAACEAVVRRHPDAEPQLEAQVGNWFREWGARGWIAEVRPRSQS